MLQLREREVLQHCRTARRSCAAGRPRPEGVCMQGFQGKGSGLHRALTCMRCSSLPDCTPKQYSWPSSPRGGVHARV